MADRIPVRGEVVDYTLDSNDVAQITGRRDASHGHVAGEARGSPVSIGDVVPMMITRVWGDTPGCAVNGQAVLDGNDTLWVTSATHSEGLRHFAWRRVQGGVSA